VRASAPGKLVLSGAYSVLEGAPAIVSAVDRYVITDSERPAEFVTAEVRAAFNDKAVPHFDASALRTEDRKLGLGSSAAILVASLAAAHARAGQPEPELRRAIEPLALRAHRTAQGGGSGIDVAASIWGGTLIATRAAPDALELEAAELPGELVVEAWASDVSASTQQLLASVARLRSQQIGDYTQIMDVLVAAARRAAQALRRRDASDLIAMLHAQREGLSALGRASRVPIVTPAVARLAAWAEPRGAAVIPSGAGGGDIVLWVSTGSSPEEFRALAERLGHFHVCLALHARGVHFTPAKANDRGT
jgi:phosphomevalonate kinase